MWGVEPGGEEGRAPQQKPTTVGRLTQAIKKALVDIARQDRRNLLAGRLCVVAQLRLNRRARVALALFLGAFTPRPPDTVASRH